MTNQPPEISVTTPVSQAFDRMKLMLFQPFDIGKWFVIGFCAWLAGLGESGGSFNGNFNNFGNDGHSHNFQETLAKVTRYVTENLYWIIPVAVGALIFLLALGMVMLWLNSRGKFMFLHCVALNKAEVKEPWQKFGRVANSLFWFRFVLGLIGAVLSLPLVAFIAIIVIRMVVRGEPNIGGIFLAAGLTLMLFVLCIGFALVQKFTIDFVVPLMFLRGEKCVSAWKEFWSLLTAHAGSFALYILFKIILAIVIGLIVVAVVLVTCCIAGCLMLLPYLGTVLLLPVLIFKRAYSVYFLAQFGPLYDVFPPIAPIPPTGLQPLPAVPPAV
ncbi:MAG: hypothetical protein WDM80_06990 [Limisphaerales bacterium]